MTYEEAQEAGIKKALERKEKTRQQQKEWRAKNSEKMKAYKREWQKKWRENNRQEYLRQMRKDAAVAYARNPEKVKARVAKSVAKWRKNNPEKVLAQRRIFVELRAGRIKKEPCFCGDPAAQAHHNDYSLQLDIEWLCKKHHQMADEHRRTIEKDPISPSSEKR